MGQALRKIFGWHSSATATKEAPGMTSIGGSYADAIGAVARMGQLANNWDGHGAGAVPALACGQATAFLQRVDAKFGPQVSPPQVGAVPGGLALIWRRNARGKQGKDLERELEIIFTEHGNEWAVSERNGLEPTMSLEDVDQDTLLQVIDRFIHA